MIQLHVRAVNISSTLYLVLNIHSSQVLYIKIPCFEYTYTTMFSTFNFFV